MKVLFSRVDPVPGSVRAFWVCFGVFSFFYEIDSFNFFDFLAIFLLFCFSFSFLLWHSTGVSLLRKHFFSFLFFWPFLKWGLFWVFFGFGSGLFLAFFSVFALGLRNLFFLLCFSCPFLVLGAVLLFFRSGFLGVFWCFSSYFMKAILSFLIFWSFFCCCFFLFILAFDFPRVSNC